MIDILAQPDDSTCGPTCLHAVYAHYGDVVDLDTVIADVTNLPAGGTLAVALGCHALARGYEATLYTHNLHLFDPTWFADDAIDLSERLTAQAAAKPDPKLRFATRSYLEFLTLGGRVAYDDLSEQLVEKLLANNTPVLTGLSATYLYSCARELGDEYDDVGGEPTGHFVVLCDFDPAARTLEVADPLGDNPRYDGHHYRVSASRLIAAILLGVVTYDANLLVIRPR